MKKKIIIYWTSNKLNVPSTVNVQQTYYKDPGTVPQNKDKILKKLNTCM